MENIHLVSGRGNLPFSKKVSKALRIPLTPVNIKTFADGEIYVRIEKKVRNEDVYIIQSVSSPVNERLMELLIMIDALKRASARRINVLSPYLCYSRQDRKADSREPITAKLVANLITKAGADRVISVDLHADQIQGFYDIPVDHLVGYPMFADYLKKKRYKDIAIVSPDVGSAKKARKMANLIHAPLVIADKRRRRHNECEITFIIGDVKDKTAVIVDDMIDTAGTVANVAHEIKKKGAKEIIICASHGILSGEAVKKLEKSPASKVLLLDTIDIPKEKIIPKMEIISIAPLLAKVIKRIHTGKSLGELFKWEEKEVAL
ncbi:ribose-phosphate pyrophosphokinase [Candidatus Microgenomates bacterium]|jgi:ribose-phosphate pyrophosphokinase|nr:MAG: ribose-phosphate pyrophosphokinase [Candidatus Microgenomates bacterium]